MVETHAQFNERLKTLGRKHQKMTGGYITRVGRDGLMTVTPKRARRGFPFKGLALIVMGFFVFKAFTLAAVGPVTYNERLSSLSNGGAVERAGAVVLAIDPLTQSLADMTGPIMR